MATTEVTSGTNDVIGERRLFDRATWGALFAGFFVGMGLLFLLLSLGAAIGFTAVDPRDLGSWRSAGIGVGIWGGISAIIASFGSAWVAGRLSTARDRTTGSLHGLALWGLTWAALLYFGAMLVSGAVGTAASAAGTAMESAATAAGDTVSGQDAERAAAEARERASAAAGQAQQQLQQRAPEVSEAAKTGGKAGAWGAFLAALFTMIASAVGGAAGVPLRAGVIQREPAPAGPVAHQRV